MRNTAGGMCLGRFGQQRSGSGARAGKTLSVEGLSDDQWVYISLETGNKVGTSPLGDAAQDAAWKARTDWDIALCGELVRTNGGTSGNGQGAIQQIPNKSFNALDQAPADGYTTDTDDIVIRR